MIRDYEADKTHEVHLEKAMFSLWLKESGESNDNGVEHLKNCIRVAISECLTEKQAYYLSLYLSGYNQTEISEMCGVSISTVSRTLARGINRLIERVKYATPRTLRVGSRVKKSLTGLYKH